MASMAKLFPVSDAEKAAILGEFGKTKENVQEDVQILREWLKKQSHIPEIKDDSLLEHVLIRNKFRIEKTKLKIDSYFTSKLVYADYFDTLDPGTEAMVKSTNNIFNCFLPKLTADHKRLHFWSMNPMLKLEEFDFKSIVRYGSILNETQMIFDYCPTIISIFDAHGLKIAFTLNIDLAIQAKMYKIYFGAFSGRISTIHVVNISPAAETILRLLKPLLPEKLQNRVQFHSNFDSLHKLIPKEYLPQEMGGTEMSAVELAKEFSATLQRERDHILARNKTSTEETLRIGKPPIETELFGVDGTFKKLSLD